MTIRILISLILFVSTAFADTSLDIPINSTYLSNYKYTAQTQLDNDTVGFMAFLSVLKFESPYMGQYSDAASKAGDVAFSLSGGQKLQDQFNNKVINPNSKLFETKILGFLHSLGITDTELGIIVGSAKIYRDKGIDVKGPRLGVFESHLTLNTDHGLIGLTWRL